MLAEPAVRLCFAQFWERERRASSSCGVCSTYSTIHGLRAPSGSFRSGWTAGTVYADVAFEREKVLVELDGAAFHGSPDRRERDIRRDAALAALGWVVLRFSYQRLHAEPEVVRREVLAVLKMRRQQLAA